MTALSNAEVAEIYRTRGHLLLRRARVILGDQMLAEDALQEALIKIMRYGGQYLSAESPLRWLYRVVDRCCFDLLARTRRRAEVSDDGEQNMPPEGASHPAAQLEVRDAVMRFLHRLGERERQIAVLALVDGMTQEQIAQETGWSRPTVNKKLQAIRKRAERQLR